MTMPNFIIIGAAKAGTSSIFQYLVQHPQIYGCPIKEPSFFAFAGESVNYSGPGDYLFNQSVVTTYDAYESLFDGVTNEFAIGEASVVYLNNKKAAVNIKRYVPRAKIIVVLRNPVDRAISSYSHLVRDGFESMGSLSEALAVEELRIQNNWQHLWQYQRLGFYCDALRNYFSLFPREQIAVYTYDALTKDPQGLLTEIYAFLGVDQSFHPDTSYRHNVSGIPRSRMLHRLLMQKSVVKDLLKPFIPKELRLSMQMKITRRNIDARGINVSEAERKYLKDKFRSDILRTQSLINKDLSGWLD